MKNYIILGILVTTICCLPGAFLESKLNSSSEIDRASNEDNKLLPKTKAICDDLKAQDILFKNFKRVCYFRMDPKLKMEVQQIDGNLCTHIIFAFCRLDSRGNIIHATSTDGNYLRQVNGLKRKYPHLKVLVSLFNENEYEGFIVASNSHEVRTKLAHSAIEFMRKYKLDGIDLDWEFPNSDHEKKALTEITEVLRNSFGTKYLLSLAVAAQNIVVKKSYEMDKLSELVDWFNMMTYDFYLYKSYSPFTGPNSPLYSIAYANILTLPILNTLSVDWTVRNYIKLGVPREKIMLGIPTYARGFLLSDNNQSLTSNTNELSSIRLEPFMAASAALGGKIGDYFDFKEVCSFLRHKNGVYTRFDDKARVPYMLINGSTWISYEDEQSVSEKVEYLINTGLGGYMTWNLNSDNFDEPCHEHDKRLNILHTAMFHQYLYHDFGCFKTNINNMSATDISITR